MSWKTEALQKIDQQKKGTLTFKSETEIKDKWEQKLSGYKNNIKNLEQATYNLSKINKEIDKFLK
ncbi:hypothetical protein EJ131_19315 [Bacillus mycoides]|nr:hypothetical protein [Bacillus mycoides]PEE23583.1 hypothetical protein CON95_12175 [Bacillus toyonensis]